MSETLGSRRDTTAHRLELMEFLLDQEEFDSPIEEVIGAQKEEDGILSFGEERLWLLDRLAPGNPAYNLAFGIRILGELNAAHLAASVVAVAARHEPLRCSYIEIDGKPVRKVAPPASLPLPIIDVAECGGEREALRLACCEAARPFNLANGPLLRALLLRTGERSHLLVAILHHIVADGWSVTVFQRELATSYAACAGEPMRLPWIEVGYGELACWQRRRLSGPVLEERIAHWRERLTGASPVLELPADHPRPPRQSYRGAAVVLPLPAQTTAALQALTVRQGASPFTVLLTAFKVFLLRLAGYEDVVVGSPVAGRERTELEDLIGFFVNMLVLRSGLEGNPSFVEALSRVRESVLDALEHQDLPFEALVAALEPERHSSHHPLFQVSFTYRQEGPPLQLGGLSWGLVNIETDTSKWDLMVEVVEAHDGWRTRFRYDRDLFEATTVVRWAAAFHTLLAAAVESPALPLSQLPLLTEQERRRILVDWNDTTVVYPSEASIPDLFAEQAERTPDAVALKDGGESLTYRELDRRANRLARRLRGLGVGPEISVALLVERSVEAVVALLAVLKAGGAYVPLDPEMPEARLLWLLDDVRPGVLVAQERWLPERLAQTAIPMLLLERDRPLLEAESDASLSSGAGPANLAYILFTSGSTGRPKGVCVTHRNVVRLVRGADYAGLGPGEVFLQLAPLAFDASTLEIWGPLLNGGRLAVCPPGHQSLQELGRVIHDEGVTTLWLTAGLFHQMVEESPESLRGLRQLLAGGDVLSPEHVRKALAARPGLRLINGYGPTEGTTFTCCHPMVAGDEPDGPVPLGRPIANTHAYGLDRFLEPVIVGVAGELFAGGDGVARGYLGRPELTAERFVPDPFSAEPGARLYRTGDLVRQRTDGRFEFLGRLDGQVKIRGFRIEPGEVEAALIRQSGVRQAAVVARNDDRGDKRLVAYIVPEAGALDLSGLRAGLRSELPDYMMPNAFVALESLPLTANGKLDRNALPEPGRVADRCFMPPATPIEELLAGIWAELLGLDEVGAEDDFFELGGHSLKATQVVSRVRLALGVDLPVRTLFEAPQLKELAHLVEVARSQGEKPPTPSLRPVPRDHDLPLSFAQERLWFLHQLEPESPAYNIPSALRLTGSLNRSALAAALAAIVGRHEALRTTFRLERGAPVQVIAQPSPLPLPWVDLSVLPYGQREAEAARLTGEEAARPFDLTRGPVVRALLVGLTSEEHIFLLTFHHVAADGWSMTVFFRELGELYQALPLPDLAIQYADFAVWQRTWLQGEILERQLAWWRERLAGLPPLLALPTDRPRPAVARAHGSMLWLTLPASLSQEIRSLARCEEATLFMVLLATFQVLLSRLSGRDDLAVGTPVAGRTEAGIEGLVGLFVNTLVLRSDLAEDPEARLLVARTRESFLEAYAHQDLPFERLVEDLRPERDLAHTPLFQVLFVLQNTGEAALELPGLAASRLNMGAGASKLDLSLAVRERRGELTLATTYRTDLFDATTVARWLEHFQTLLAGFVETPKRRLSELPLLTGPEHAQLLREWSRTESETSPWPPFHQLFSAQAWRQPDTLAAVAGETAITYGELDRQSGRLARHLRCLGVGPEVVVALYAERSVEALVGLLGIARAGGAYAPLDPDLPSERLAFLLTDTRTPVVVTQEHLASRLPLDGPPPVFLEADWPEGPGGGKEPEVLPENLAYVIFTSGSTGEPKGVAVEHRQLGSYLHAVAERLDLAACRSFAMVSTLAADLGHTVLYPSLCLGGCLHIVARDVATDPLALERYFERHPVDCLKIVPSHLLALLAAAPVGRLLPRRRLVLGGEASSWDDVDRLRALVPGCAVFNHYGPTETTVGVLTHRVDGPDGTRRTGSVPLGRPLAGREVYLLDIRLDPVPAGVPGEVFLGGAGLARGYLGRPAQTAERFIPHPWSDTPGARLYRTGDLARFLPDGTVEFLGRVDDQVKIRGFRIEPGEIEAALERHPAVREAAVVARADNRGEKRLVAYVVPEPGPLDLSGLRAGLRRELPDSMVPTAFVVLESLPLTPNGKLDRHALPEPRSTEDRNFVPPATPVEEMLAGIWAELLGLDEVGAEDDFFSLGGHSLLALRLVARLRDLLYAEVSVRAVFEAPTVRQLAAEVEKSLGRRDVSEPIPQQDVPVVSFAQERLWFLEQLEQRPLYNVPLALHLSGRLDVPALNAALAEIVRRHQVLRTALESTEAGPVPRVHPAALFLPVVDLTALAEAAQAEAARLGAREALYRFDLSRSPLLRASLLRLAPEQHRLLLNLHHIASDGWSMEVLLNELEGLYEALCTGRPSPLPELPIQYADFAAWQRERLQGSELDEQIAWWQERLAGLPPLLELPTDRPRPPVQGGGGAAEMVHLGPELSQAVRTLARQNGATLFLTLLSAFQALLSRYTGRDDIAVGTPVTHRDRSELHGLIGLFVNTLVVRLDLSEDPDFLELLRRTRQTTLEAFAHQDLPFEKLVEVLQPQRDLAHSPLFQVMFLFQRPASEDWRLPGVEVTRLRVETGTAKFDLTLGVKETEAGLTLLAGYRTDLFDRPTITRMLGHFQVLLAAAAAQPALRLSQLPLLTEEERRRILVDWNDTTVAYPREASIPDLFAEQAERTPDAVALKSGGESLTYRELDRRANRLARRLRGLGVGPEIPVALLVERSVEAVVTLLAVLKAGGAYVPLDPEMPEARLLWLLDDVRPGVLVAQERWLPERLAQTAIPMLLLERDRPLLEAESDTAFRSGAGPANLAYILFTSGSTGRPKGVCVTHRNVVRLVRGADYADLGPREVFLQLAPLAFDASTLEIWGPLLNGGRLAVCPPGHQSLQELGRVIHDEGVTTLWLTAGLFHQMVEEGPESLRGLHQLLAGGDVLSPEHVRKILAILPGLRLINGYGPTEGTTFTCCHPMDVAEELDGPVPLGRPIANTRAYGLDRFLEPVIVGVAGELFAGGDGVARGYLGRPELTAERFVPDPFSAEPGARLYRTGDLVRQRAGGRFEFLGRLDSQVKIRGFRIEPGEVEAALIRQSGVRQAAVVARNDERGEKRLVAYIVPEAGALDLSGLRAGLRSELPDYMMPNAFVALESLPLTANGKLDRSALPEPGRVADRCFMPPATPIEELLAGIWAELLGLDEVGAEDDFFELGGHSLLALRLVARLRDLLHAEVSVRAVFETPTVRQLATEVEKSLGRHDACEPIPKQDVPVVSFAQERLWFLEQLELGPLYNIPLVLHLAGPLAEPALEAALAEILRRHQVLRTALESTEAGPVPRVHPAALFLPVVDLTALAEAAQAEAARLGAREALYRFDLSRSPLLRASLLRLAPEQHRLLLNLHHIASDGWSMEVLLNELGVLYEALSTGRPSPLPEPPIQYADFAAWQRERLQGSELDEQIAWWHERLAGLPPLLELPTDRPRPPVQGGGGAAETVHLGPGLSQAVRTLARQNGATLFLTLLAAFQALLSRYTGRDDIAVGTPVTHRDRSELHGLIGLFVNTLVVRLDLSEDPDFLKLLRRTRQTTLEAFAHQDLPFEKLVEVLQPQRDLAHSPLFQVMFLFQKPVSESLRLPGMEVTLLRVDTVGSKFDLTLGVKETEAGLTLMAGYRTDLFDHATIARLLGHFQTLLAAAAAHPDLPLSRLPLLTGEERRRILIDWNDTGFDEPSICLHEWVAAQAARTPNAVALVCAGERLSYAELNRRATHLAWRLRALGVGPEVPVGICLDRSADLVVALLAALMAGGAYVPLDPDYPRERIAWIVDDAQTPVVLTRETLAETLGLHRPGVHVLGLQSGEAVDGGEAPLEPSGVRPENLAYVIYTSGSTGRPKGVAIEHRSASALLAWALRFFAPEELRTVFAGTSVCFDLSVFELFVPLSCGGTVLLGRDALELSTLPGTIEVTLLNTVPSAMDELVRLDAVPASVRAINLAGEPLRRDLVDRLHALPGANRVLNLYGPSEDTTYSTGVVMRRGDIGEPSIGRPIDGTRVYLIDSAFNPVPVGVAGELCLTGAGLARGYFGNPERTAERFVPDPFSATSGNRLYRTGDLARYRPDGEIEFLGRLDHQVKIRGFRIELGEIEAVLARQEDVGEAVVVAREDTPGDKRLVAYVTPRQDGTLSTARLRSRLGEQLPAYMVPAQFVLVETLPRTPNGKIDRKALPTPEAPDSVTRSAPATPIEELLAGIWAELLGVAEVSAEDNFFELGGHSLLAMRVVARLRDLLHAEVSVRAVFEAPTVRQLAGEVEKSLGRPGVSAPIPPQGLPVVSFAQERLWFLEQLEQGPLYNIPLVLHLAGPLAASALEAALAEILRRHQVLRTALESTEAGPVPRIHPAALFLPVVDLTALAGAAQAEVDRLSVQEAARRFDLTRPPLLRASLLRLAPERHRLLLNLHHIAADGWSMEVLLDELGVLYEALSTGRPSLLPEPPLQYADFAAWQRERLQGSELDEQIAWWHERLAGLPPLLELPTDRPRPPVQGGGGATETVHFGPELSQAVRTLARQNGATLFLTSLAAFQALLCRYTGRDDIAVGTPVTHRDRSELHGLIGLFVNTLVVRLDLGGDPDFLELLRRTRRTTLEALAHQDLPFEKLVEALQPQRDLAHSPLFQVLFLFQKPVSEGWRLPGVEVTPLRVETGVSKFDLTLGVEESEAGLTLLAGYRTDLFDRATITRLLEHFQTLIAAAAAHPDLRLSELPLLSEEERRRILAFGSGAVTEIPALLVHQLFEQQVERAPDRVAVTFEGASLSYGELNRRANRLAHHLRRFGVGPEIRVGLCAQRSPDLLVGLLGVLKAGGAYVPLDPAYPPSRLALVMEDAGIEIFLTDCGTCTSLPAQGVRAVDLDGGVFTAENEENPRPRTKPEGLAYAIYTSGSTGRPKGVEIKHRSIVNFLLSMACRPGLRERDVLVALTTISFDIAVLELLLPLVVGARIELADRETAADGQRLAALLEESRATFVQATPATWRMLLDSGWPGNQRLVALCGGEALPLELAKRLTTHVGALWNVYGPTETTIWSAALPVGDEPWFVPIGGPLDNTELYIVDRHFGLTPLGVAGELLIGGEGLARGYLDRPDLTAEKFVPNPFGPFGGRLYRTGDLVRRRPDGAIEFSGRLDHQVKVRGFRIEVGEVEGVLLSHPAVREAAVTLHKNRREDCILAAHFVAGGEPCTPAQLRAFLRERLPEYMVPTLFVPLSCLPRTPNGKVDRKALTAPEEARAEAVAYLPPGTETERLIASVWREALGVERVGVQHNFFDLGGHSLLLVQVLGKLRTLLRRSDLTLVHLFNYPDIDSLARFLADRKDDSTVLHEAQGRARQQLAGRSRRQQILSKFKDRSS